MIDDAQVEIQKLPVEFDGKQLIGWLKQWGPREVGQALMRCEQELLYARKLTKKQRGDAWLLRQVADHLLA